MTPLTPRHLLLALAMLASLLALAFAPAPFPRQRRVKETSAPSMEGMWEGNSRLLITAKQLTYHPGQGEIAYDLRVDRNVSPPTYDLLYQSATTVSWMGIY